MKKEFLSLSTIFFIACSSNDVNGYTSSIIKDFDNISDSPLSLYKKSFTDETSLELEEDFSSLDDDVLREKLMNSYPLPKADPMPKQAMESSSSAQSTTSSSETLYDLPHKQNTGVIELFDWKVLSPDFMEPQNYPYGFDKDQEPDPLTDPLYDPLVYISVEVQKNKTTTQIELNSNAEDIPLVELYVPVEHKAFTDFYLLHNKYTKDLLDENGALIKGDNKITEKLAKQIIEHGIKFTNKTEYKEGSNIKYYIYNKLEDHQNNTYALGYSKTKNDEKEYIIYPPLTQENSQLKKYVLDEGIYHLIAQNKSTMVSRFLPLQKRFQILHYPRKEIGFVFVQIDGKEINGWSAKKEKNSITKESVKETFNKIYNQAVVYPNMISFSAKEFGISENINYELTSPNNIYYNEFKNKADEQRRKNGALKDYDSPYWHTIFAINQMRKKWSLKNCKDKLSDCTGFKPEDEPEYTTYKMYGCSDEGYTEENAQDVKIKISIKKATLEDGKTKTTKEYHIVRKAKNGEEKEGYRDCHILYTDNGIPIIPTISSYFGALAVSVPTEEKIGHIPRGSTIFVPRTYGESGQNVVMHELGHSFGFTDVARKKDLVRKTQFVENSNVKPYVTFYASAETNLMTWQVPSGRKIRYRATPIACTGGTNYYYLDDNSNLNPIGGIERALKGAGENQWECIRGKCFDEDFMNKNIGSKEFWDPSDTKKCKNNNLKDLLSVDYFDKPENKEYKNVLILVKDEYNTMYNNSMKPKTFKYMHVQPPSNK